MMEQKFFNSTRDGNLIGDGSVGDLINWIAKFVNISFPENEINDWYRTTKDIEGDLHVTAMVPEIGIRDDCLAYPACFVRNVNSKRQIICILLCLSNGSFATLTQASSDGNSEQNWMIARAITSALESILIHQRIPLLVELAAKVPTLNINDRETNETRNFTFSIRLHQLRLVSGNGVLIEDFNWTMGDKESIDKANARVHDWKLIMKNMKVNYTVTTNVILIDKSTPGYIYVDCRGTSNGIHVLPPGRCMHTAGSYLGVFTTEELAIEAAHQHQSNT